MDDDEIYSEREPLITFNYTASYEPMVLQTGSSKVATRLCRETRQHRVLRLSAWRLGVDLKLVLLVIEILLLVNHGTY
jgi:hypothetical protein